MGKRFYLCAKRCDYDTGLLELIIKFKCVVLHGDIELREEAVSLASVQYVRYDRQRVLFAANDFVEFMEVTDPPYSTILLRGDEGWRVSFTSACW